MKVLLDIEDQKADFVLELLKNLKFVKAKPISTYKAEVFENIKQSVEEFNLIQEGKIKAIPAKELLDEL
jgi:predicted P-loop ATPase/GTPase